MVLMIHVRFNRAQLRTWATAKALSAQMARVCVSVCVCVCVCSRVVTAQRSCGAPPCPQVEHFGAAMRFLLLLFPENQ